MSRLSRDDWRVYATMRTEVGKDYAERFRHRLNRNYSRKGINHGARYDSPWQLVKDYGIDGYLSKRFFPGHDDPSYLEDLYTIEPIRAAYDCTGCIFTGWIKGFRVPGGIVVYHSISVDI